MDILTRNFDGAPYVWKKAKFTNGQIMVGDRKVSECNIVSIHNDERKKYVVCSVCGSSFRKGSKKIEEHKLGCNDDSHCFSCRWMRMTTHKTQSQKYELLDDGRYISKTKTEVSLRCSRSSEDINHPESKQYCVYNRCKEATMTDVKGFFLDKPGAFDSMATIDKVVEAGYKSAWHDSWNGNTYYALKTRNIIDAIVNKLNIIDGFRVSYKRQNYVVYYSKKYDELYTNDRNSTYCVWSPWNIPLDTRAYIKNKIAALYN